MQSLLPKSRLYIVCDVSRIVLHRNQTGYVVYTAGPCIVDPNNPVLSQTILHILIYDHILPHVVFDVEAITFDI